MRWPFFAAVSLVATSAAAPAAAAPPVVVELFTSEGCSSCPPADRFLAELARERGDVLPLAFHVTYWDSLGWRDPFALPAATQRQNDYAASFGSGSVFTPQMVIDGRHSVVGSDRAEAGAAIAEAQAARAGTQAARAGTTVTLQADRDRLRIKIGGGTGTGRILLLGFDHQHSTHVGRGENSGRTLVEANIVRTMSEAGVWAGRPVSLSVPVPAGEDAAVLVQGNGGAILGAARLER